MIRAFRTEDAEQVARVHERSIRQLASKDYSPAEVEVWAAKCKPEAYVKSMTADKHRVVYERGGEIVGFGDYERKDDEAKLNGLYVDPDHTGEGVGGALLEQLEASARRDGAEKLTLESTITAHGFYERHGYKTLGEETHRIGEQHLKVYRMEKEL